MNLEKRDETAGSFDVPRITVVTPSYNQASYLETTIRSVIDQDYPNVEYIIIDGGSTDGSVEIIERYADRLAYWVSEPDDGQAHAINKGLVHATGDVLAYLNSDDIYLPGTLRCVARACRENPEADLFHGECLLIVEDGAPIGSRQASITRFDELLDVWNVWWQGRNFVQPEVFWTRRITEKIGLFDPSLFMVMDYEYWTRILRVGGKVFSIPEQLAAFRITSTQKSIQRDRSNEELLRVVERLLWDRSTPLGEMRRLRLQARWLYHQRFLEQVRNSIKAGEPRWKRLLGGVGLCLKFPYLLLEREYRRRVLSAITSGRWPRS